MHFRGARDGAEFGKTWILATVPKPSQAFSNFILQIGCKCCYKALLTHLARDQEADGAPAPVKNGKKKNAEPHK
jgi:hypothetical protein